MKMKKAGDYLAANAKEWRRSHFLQDSTLQRRAEPSGGWPKSTPLRRVTIAQMQPVRIEESFFKVPDMKQRNEFMYRKLRSNQGVLILDVKLQQKYCSRTNLNGDTFNSQTLEFERRQSRFSSIVADCQKSFCDSCSSLACSCITSTPSGLPPISRKNTPGFAKKDLVRRWLSYVCS